MKTVTLDILDDKAMNLLKDMELLKIIRLRRDKTDKEGEKENLVRKYKGAMTPLPIKEVDRQLSDLRNGWE